MSASATNLLRALCCSAVLVTLQAALAPVALRGQDPDLLRRLERQLRDLDTSYRIAAGQDRPISERFLLDYGGWLRFGVLGVDDRFGNTRVLRSTDSAFYLRADLDGAHRFYAQLRFLYNDFNPGESFDGNGDELEEPLVDRYWYAFDLRGAHLARTGQRLAHNVAVKVGRQFVNWGSGLALSQVLYAGVVDAEFGDLGFTGLVAQTPTTGTVDFDGSRPSFDTNTQRQYFGGRLEYLGSASHRPFISALIQSDKNDRDFVTITTATASFPTRFDYNSQYLSLGSQGNLGPEFIYRLELVYERGRGLSNSFNAALAPIGQTHDDIEAWAGIATLAYLLRDERDTRFELELLAGSGNDDRIDSSDTFGGNASGTKDRAFNGLGYVNTGLALAPEISNLFSVQVGASTSVPFLEFGSTKFRTRFSGFLFAKVNDDAPLNVPTLDHELVGGEIDWSGDWRLTSDLSLSFRYGVFLAADAIPSDQDDPRQFGFVGVSYAF